MKIDKKTIGFAQINIGIFLLFLAGLILANILSISYERKHELYNLIIIYHIIITLFINMILIYKYCFNLKIGDE